MAIDNKQIEHLAKLARLKVDKKEEQQLQKQIADILQFVSALQEVDTTGVEPSFYGVPANNLKRQDEVVESEDKDDVKRAMPEVQDDLLKTPKIFS